jgi:uncharacterized protein
LSAFADSSALVKLYVYEQGNEVIRAVSTLVISQVARVEVAAALWCKHRIGELDRSGAAVLIGNFEADYHGTQVETPRFVVVPTSVVIYEAAARIARVHGLRAYDSIQLASGLLARQADPEIRDFATWDKQLGAAASAEGFTLIPA